MHTLSVDNSAQLLLHGWSFNIPCWRYILLVFVLSVVIRAGMCVVKALEMWLRGKSGQFDCALHLPPRPRFWKEFQRSMKGYGSIEPLSNDYWLPFLLGTMELFAFPVLMATNNWTFIGAWLGFKALAQARNWIENRSSFNRFIFGTAMLLFASYFLACNFVEMKNPYLQQSATETAFYEVLTR